MGSTGTVLEAPEPQVGIGPHSSLVLIPVPVQYRSTVLAQYRYLYRHSTDTCTGAVPIPVLAQYRSMTKAGINPQTRLVLIH
jgi:hypothetical protein